MLKSPSCDAGSPDDVRLVWHRREYRDFEDFSPCSPAKKRKHLGLSGAK
jgi:hypothetical protein